MGYDMATTKEKYDKLTKKNKTQGSSLEGTTNKNALQLVYPSDYLTSHAHAGHVVMLEINRVVGERSGARVEIKGLESQVRNARLKGAYGSEVAMQGEAGMASMRSKDVDGKDNLGVGKVYEKTGEMIVLPMPPQFQLSQSALWSASEIGAIGSAQDFVNSLDNATSDAAKSQLTDSAGRMVAGGLQSLGATKALDYLEMKSGFITNPYNEVLFKGTTNRYLPLVWNLIAKNAKDAELIHAIYHRLRFHMSPEVKGGNGDNSAFLVAPSTFDISFMDLATGKIIPWLPKFSTCALLNVEYNPTLSGEWAVSPDGSPLSASLSVNFMEMTTGVKNIMTDIDNSF